MWEGNFCIGESKTFSCTFLDRLDLPCVVIEKFSTFLRDEENVKFFSRVSHLSLRRSIKDVYSIRCTLQLLFFLLLQVWNGLSLLVGFYIWYSVLNVNRLFSKLPKLSHENTNFNQFEAKVQFCWEFQNLIPQIFNFLHRNV